MIGRTIAHYQVSEKIGAGGMGEVYRASDPRLGRDVALKVLPTLFTSDASRMARFQREAQLLAALNHPNIASLYGLEESDGERALVMELVEGPTLAERIKQGPLPLEDALRIAKQVAEALEYAHERGIIHRDLKPGNVKLRADGAVKLLDFGLAKALGDSPDPKDVSHSPTLTAAATQVGILLGTAAYMAPEQAKGKPVDRRADVWAFGVVLFEIISGKQIFSGETISETLASVIKDEPDWTLLPVSLPPSIQNLLRRCLRKDQRLRLQAIGDARVVIEEYLAQPDSPLASGLAPISFTSQPHARRILPWALCAMLAATALLALWRSWVRPPPALRSLHLRAELGTDGSLFTVFGPSAILSPDGTRLAFVKQSGTGDRQLYVRSLEQFDAKLLAGTEGAQDPFFSPDGQWIGFFAGGRLKKVSVESGGVVPLCELVADRGGSWGDDGNIVFASIRSSLFRVSSTGGIPEPITQLDQSRGEITHRWPQVLPGSKAVLFDVNSTPGNYSQASIIALNLADHSRKTIVQSASYARYLPTGHLIFSREDTLFAARFDLRRLELTGVPVPVLERVSGSPTNGGAQFSASDTGTLAYIEGEFTNRQMMSLAWLDRQGNLEPLPEGADASQIIKFSPDGTRIAVDGSRVAFSIWLYDWKRSTMTRFTFEKGLQYNPVWTPDGSRIAYSSSQERQVNMFWRRADGSGEAERLTQSNNSQWASSFHPSGKWLAYTESDPQTKNDIWLLPLEGDEKSGWKPGKPQPFLRTPYTEGEPAFSSDGRWIAYESDESGVFEVYVRPFPGPGGKWQISSGGGSYPVWSRTGSQLYFLNSSRQIMTVPYRATGDSFLAGKPELWSKAQIGGEAQVAGGYTGQVAGGYTFPPDEKRAVVLTMSSRDKAAPHTQVGFIVNFFEELRRKVPATGN